MSFNQNTRRMVTFVLFVTSAIALTQNSLQAQQRQKRAGQNKYFAGSGFYGSIEEERKSNWQKMRGCADSLVIREIQKRIHNRNRRWVSSRPHWLIRQGVFGHRYGSGFHVNPHREIDSVEARRNFEMRWEYSDWKDFYPEAGWWWYEFCGTDYYFDPSNSSIFDWNFFPLSTDQEMKLHWYQYAQFGKVPEETVTYRKFGINGVYIPGVGLGIQQVQPDSPAEKARLQPGMIILAVDENRLVKESTINEVMRDSDGSLDLTIIASADSEERLVVVELERVEVKIRPVKKGSRKYVPRRNPPIH